MFLVLLSLVFNSYAQPEIAEELLPEKKIEDIRSLREELLTSMKSSKVDKENLDKYVDDIEIFRNKSSKYTELKNRECKGEFSSIVINEDGVQKLKKKELTNEEKEACYQQLKNFHMTFTNLVFKLRKEYLGQIHKSQIESLETTRLNAIAKLEQKFKTKSRDSSKARRKNR